MIKVNLMGDNLAIQQRKVEDFFLKAEYPVTVEFLVEYLSTVKVICTFAVLRGYKVSVRREEHFKFYVTVEAEKLMPHSLVDEAVKDIDFDTPLSPEYVGI